MSQEKNNAGHEILTFWIVNDFKDKLGLNHGSNEHIAVSRDIVLDISRIQIEEVLHQEKGLETIQIFSFRMLPI